METSHLGLYLVGSGPRHDIAASGRGATAWRPFASARTISRADYLPIPTSVRPRTRRSRAPTFLPAANFPVSGLPLLTGIPIR